jgi:hypothetical protein
LIIVLVEKIEKKQHSGVKNVSFFCLDKTWFKVHTVCAVLESNNSDRFLFMYFSNTISNPIQLIGFGKVMFG